MKSLLSILLLSSAVCFGTDIDLSKLPNIPKSNIPESGVAKSVVAESEVQETAIQESEVAETEVAVSVTAESSVAESTISHYERWSAVMKQATEFPARLVPFKTPVNPVMVQLDDPAHVATLAQQAVVARLQGRTVYLSYSPYRQSILAFDVAEVLDALESLAPLADGFAPCYRRTGAHYMQPNRNLAAMMCQRVRKANPEIQLLGEVYFGDLHDGEVKESLEIFTFPACSALLGVNLPRGGRKEVEAQLQSAGIADLNLIDVLPVGVPSFRRYRNVLYVEMNGDN